MKILVIEDNKEELAKAKEIIEAMGHEVMACDPGYVNPFIDWIKSGMSNMLLDMEDADGVITDLNFELPGVAGRRSGITQSGLLVALHAASCGKPVVICTRFEEGDNHHGKAASWIFDGYVMAMREISNLINLPKARTNKLLGWVESKDWKLACEKLEKKFAAL